MKKIISVILMTALLLAMCVPVFAADDSRSTYISFIYTPAEPIYNVTIPAEWYIDIDGGDWSSPFNNFNKIEVSDTENLNGQSIIITIDYTQDYIDYAYGLPICLNSSEPSDFYSSKLQYELYNITLIETYMESAQYEENSIPFSIYAGDLCGTSIGKEIAEFNKNGTQIISFYFDIQQLNTIEPNVAYTGYVTFGIRLGEGIVDWKW